ncbi:integrator complex subunit 6 [Tribolium madens]|uniref:integrator complex subunit 6 n=1 Tax=Tribolium madens TaxID=41895 RepID=UPI001CF76067|nr:integrator complex subunit 6 [Tribolium madens]
MTIIVFLIDTSASMLQRTYIGGRTTLLDVAKSAVETFVKIRQRSMDSRIDRYMLLTFEETPNNIKAGWKENLATFMNELKNLQCYSMTTMGVAVKQAFDILNINRMTSGIDTYGQGRCPFFLETSVIVLITDGGKLTTINGVHEEFNLPMHSPVPGSELTREPFRWDQRLFALVLRLTGTPAIERDTGLVPSDSSPIDAMCEVTGGRSYCITSHRMLNQCIDSLVQKVQNGVVINFEKIGPDPPPPVMEKSEDGKEEPKDSEFDDRMNPPILSTNWHNCRKMIYVPKSSKSYCVGFWPIPESFWPEVTASVLPARSAHPNIKFTCTNSEPLVIENLPFDKYELEPSPLTQYVLSRKQPKTCWQVFVANSYKNSEVGHPFGYLKASTNLNCVNLFVMPYNYPVLLPLLDELAKIHRWKPTNEWRTQFQNYLRTLPAYYAGPLRRALTRMGTPLALAQTLIPENSENLSYSVSNYLKRLKNQAKVEYDKLCSEITLRQNAQMNMKQNSEQIRVLPKVTLKKELISHPLLMDKFNAHRNQLLDQTNPFHVTLDKERQNVSFKNPFDIPRNRLVQQVVRMRNNFLQPDWISLDQDSAHSLPISQMGNYQEYLKRQTPQLREIESAPVRQHMFGNPFKIDKRMMVDEADIDLVASPGANRNNKRPIPNTDIGGRLPLKRKPGPLPKNFSIRRPSGGVTPPMSPVPMAPSPVPWTSVIEKDLPSFDERPTLVTVNGLDSPSSSERSRSPSPTLDMPSYSVNEVNYARNSNPYNYTNSGALDTVTTNSLNDFYPSVCDDKQSISQILKEANSVSVANSQPDVKPKITAEDLQEIENQNNEIRKHLHKLVRRPGKNFTELFDNIKTLKGNIEIQVKMVELIIKESLRFKRQHLAHLLEEYIQNLLTCENK